MRDYPIRQAESEQPGRLRWAWQDLVPLGGILLLTCLYAHRVILNLTADLAGAGRDAWQNLWNMWWFKSALLGGKNPYFTDMLYFPNGTSLLFHTLNPFNCALALPLDAAFGQPAAYNIVFLFSFVATGYFMYLLARELLCDRQASFVAGCVLTFSLFHFAHAQGHLQVTAMEWVPLFVLLLVRVWRYRRIKDGVFLGLTLALAGFCDIYYLGSSLLIAFLGMLLQAFRAPRDLADKRLWTAIGSGAAVYLATGGILVAAMLVKYLTADIIPSHDSTYYSADLQAFFVPPWISAYGDIFRTISRRWTGTVLECCQYIGYSVLVLCAVAMALRPKGRRPWPWLGLAAVGAILSLGPVLHWGGRIFSNVPLPFKVVEKSLAFIRMSGLPVRWYFLTVFATAILAGIGTATLRERCSKLHIGRIPMGLLVAPAVLVTVLVELAPRWIETRRLEQPAFIAMLRNQAGTFAIYDLGLPGEALLRQTGHGHPLISGYISRDIREVIDFVRKTPVLRALRGELKLPPGEVRRQASELKLRYVIIPAERETSIEMSKLGLTLCWQEQGHQVWEVASPKISKAPVRP